MRLGFWAMIGVGALATGAAPAFAQQTTTGPQGLAEPEVKLPKGTAVMSSLPTAPVAAVPAATPDNILDLDLSTGGRVQVQLRPDKAPNSVERVKVLARRGFYNGLTFHRVIEGFMAQAGDPKGDGTGGSDLPDLKAEFNDLPHLRGAMAMARAEGQDSANSQFYLMLQPNMKLDGKYTVIGRVISGMAYVDAVERGEPPANPSRIVRASIDSDHVPPPPPGATPPAPAVLPAAAPGDAAATTPAAGPVATPPAKPKRRR